MFVSLLFFKPVAALNDSIVLMESVLNADYANCKQNATEGLTVDIVWQGQLACVENYFKQLPPQGLTNEEWSFFNESRLGLFPPPTGKRTRREVRTLSDDEWKDVVVVWQTMYKNGTLQRFGRLHGLAANASPHMGAAFLVWHRVYITHFEEEMRKINPNVSLPYWDYTLDYPIDKPTDSVVWTPCFFGNNDDIIQTGHFSYFYGAHGAYVSRAAAECGGKLINKADLERIQNICHYKDISRGPNDTRNISHLEVLHNEVHNWVGGDMGIVETAAFDPIFFMHHAFIDYIFEQFRKHQKDSCKDVNIEEDYPFHHCIKCNDGKSHGHDPNDTMFAYSYLRNIDGLWLNWTTEYFDYEPAPSCPDNCKGKYMYCSNNVCLTKTVNACMPSITAGGEAVLKPKVSLKFGRKFQGLRKDDRTRDMTEEESRAILNQETFGTNYNISEAVDQQLYKDRLGTGIGVGFIIGVVVKGAAVAIGFYIRHKRVGAGAAGAAVAAPSYQQAMLSD